ncbi:MAG: hypothetical protein V1754_08560 [Pseudomonadota bacterium]
MIPKLLVESPYRLSRITQIGWLSCITLLGFLSFYLWYGPDIFYHLYLGERILAAGSVQPPDRLILQQATSVNIYWLFQVVVAALYRFLGVVGVSVTFFVLWLFILVIWAMTTGAIRQGGYGVLMCLLTVLMFSTRFEPRPEVISYLICSLQVYWLFTWDFQQSLGWKRYLFYFLAEAFWANVHGYFAFGPVLVIVRLTGALLNREGHATIRRLSALLGCTLLASVASPMGTGTWKYVWYLFKTLGELRYVIQEFHPPVGEFLTLWTVKLFWIAWAATIVLGVLLAFRKKLSAFVFMLGVVGLYLGATVFRNIPLFVILVAPVWAGLPEIFRHRPSKKSKKAITNPLRGAEYFIALATIFLSVFFSLWIVQGGYYTSLRSETAFRVGLSTFAYPTYFCDWFKGKAPGGRLFNNSSDGGFLEYHFPEQTWYIDSRFSNAQSLQNYFAATNDPDQFLLLHNKETFSGALLRVRENARLIISFIQSQDWELTYLDLHRAFFMNRRLASGLPKPDIHPSFYRGEDFTQKVHGMSAIMWIDILTQTNQRLLLLQAIDDFGKAQRIPSFVLEFGLGWAIKHRDTEVFEKLASLRPRMLSLQGEDQQEVDRLLVTRW